MKDIARRVKLLRPVSVGSLKIRKDNYFANAYIIDLPLDSLPDHTWQDLLERQWKASRGLWDRKLFVVGDELRLVTTIDDIEGKLEWVKQIIEETNRSIDEYNKEAKVINAREDEDVQEENSRVQEIRKILKRTLGSL